MPLPVCSEPLWESQRDGWIDGWGAHRQDILQHNLSLRMSRTVFVGRNEVSICEIICLLLHDGRENKGHTCDIRHKTDA